MTGASGRFSAALYRGLIEAEMRAGDIPTRSSTFSAALCRGLIEARVGSTFNQSVSRFSAALCRGLIEAR